MRMFAPSLKMQLPATDGVGCSVACGEVNRKAWWRYLERQIRFLLFFAPSILFAFLAMAPTCSDRWSLISHGIPFARVVPKEKLNIFQYVKTDNFRARAIVFSGGKVVGWIYQPMFGFARYVRFSATPSFQNIGNLRWAFEDYLLIAWHGRWLLVAAQVSLLLYWFGYLKRDLESARNSGLRTDSMQR